MSIPNLLERWQDDQTICENIVDWRTLPPAAARTVSFPDGLHPGLRNALIDQGIRNLYLHQAAVWKAVDRDTICDATGTASGKTLAYNMPVLDRLLRHLAVVYIYFPPKPSPRIGLLVFAVAFDSIQELGNQQGLARYPLR
jgi:DEAD/DEAH box helicase domain-containing protein